MFGSVRLLAAAGRENFPQRVKYGYGPLRRDLSRYVFVKKCAIRIDKKQKERYGKKYCHHSPSIEESLLQDAVMRAIMQTAKQNVEV